MDHSFEWEDFIRHKAKKLYNYILKFVSFHEDAEDIVQNSFAELLKNSQKLDESYYEQWLYRVAHNKSMNLLKSNQNKRKKLFEIQKEVPLYWEEDLQDDPEKKKAFMRECFQELKAKHAIALELQYYQKKSYKEISEILDISVPAVESLLVRAKKELKKILQEKRSLNVIEIERSS